MSTEVQDQNITPEQFAEQEERDFLEAAGGEAQNEAPDEAPATDELPDDPGGEEEGGDVPLAAEGGDTDIDLSSLPESVVAKLEEKLTAQIEQKLSGRLRNIEGHIGGLKHNLQQLSTAAQAAEAQGADAPSGAQMRDAMQSGAKMKELMETFPEFAEALEEFGSSITSRIPQVDMNSVNQRIESTEQTMQQMMERNRQIARLDNAFPDWEQTINSEQYQKWLSNQPNDIQALTASNSATDAIKVLKAYADSTQASDPDLTAQRRQKQSRLENAVAPTGGRPAQRPLPKTEEEEFLAAYNS